MLYHLLPYKREDSPKSKKQKMRFHLMSIGMIQTHLIWKKIGTRFCQIRDLIQHALIVKLQFNCNSSQTGLDLFTVKIASKSI